MNWMIVFAYLFYMGCLSGWGIELVYRRFFSKANPDRKWINPGFLMGPYLPLYGFGLLTMYLISYGISWHLTGNDAIDTVIIIVIMALSMTGLEYIAGLIFIKKMHVILWDYNDEKFNIGGIICLKFSIYWGILGCAYYFLINPYVIDKIIWLSQHLTFSFVIGLFFGIFLVDVVYSMKLAQKIRKFADEKGIVVFYFDLKEYMDSFREERGEKKRFLMALHSGTPLKDVLEDYSERRYERRMERREMIKTLVQDIKDEIDD